MIPAKSAKDGTQIEKYIKDKCDEIEESIELCMSIGLSYFKYSGHLPPSIQNMLKELGYNILRSEDALMGVRYIISWGDVKEDIKCN